MKTIKYIIFSGIIILQSFLFVRVLGCLRLADSLHISSYDLELRIIEAVHNDNNIPLYFVRMFHNKLLGSLIDIATVYLRYWDMHLLLMLFSLIGVVGIVLGSYYILQSRNYFLKAMLSMLFLLPFTQVFTFRLPVLLFTALFYILVFIVSIVGIQKYIINKKRLSIIISLLVISIWYSVVFIETILNYCFLS